MRVPASEAAAYRLLERLRWDGVPPACPHCAAPGRCFFLRPADGVARPTRTGAPTARRVWKCGACRRQFSVLTGTIFEGTRIPLRTWLAAIAGAGSATELGLSRDGARHLDRRLSAAFEALPTYPGATAPTQPGGTAPTQPGGEALLCALLALPAGEAARIRQRTPGRARPRRQIGPTAEYR